MKACRIILLALVAWGAVAAVPTPRSHFGHEMGAANYIANREDVWLRCLQLFVYMDKFVTGDSDRFQT